MGLTAGDEVVVPAATFVATLEAVTQAGGVPVVVDISDQDYCLDPDAAAAAIGPRTHSLMPVHLYGQMADMHALRRVARAHAVAIIEDACQAHGAERDGLRAGTVGARWQRSASTRGRTSAQPATPGRSSPPTRKRRHACAPCANMDRPRSTSTRTRAGRRDWTRSRRSFCPTSSHCWTSWNDQRRAAARLLRRRCCAGTGDLRLPPVPEGSSPVWHLYVVRTADPEALARFLRERGIGTGRHYPEPSPSDRRHTRASATVRGDFPVAEALARECLSLPMYPGHHRGAARRGRRRCPRVLRWLTRRRTRRRIA